jgi:DNA-binding LacI/PurR family transcriptional regulator
MAAEHLLALGHKRFAILSLELRADGRTGFVDRERLAAADYAGTRARLAGYGAALAAAGIPADAVPVIELVNDRAGAAEGAATLLDHVPEATAVLAMSDVAALGLLGEAAARGIAVPDRLSIVGFDDVPEAAAADPPLTTIRQPIREKGRRAGFLILDGGEPRHELLPVELVVRGTTAPPRA